MLTYVQVLGFYLIPPIVVLLGLLYPILGRREGLKVAWLAFMATVWTTPWDNFILSQSGWTYLSGSILGTIHLVPIEEHLFFILQPIFIVLLHTLCSHGRLIPFDPEDGRISLVIKAHSSISDGNSKRTQGNGKDEDEDEDEGEGEDIVDEVEARLQTLPRRPFAVSFWAGVFVIGLGLVNEAHGFYPQVGEVVRLNQGMKGFYLGWILVWISPVIGWLTFLGARGFGTRAEIIAWVIGSGWLCALDSIAISNGAWSISEKTTLGWKVIPGLPFEEFIFFLLTNHLLILSSSLISHLHTILVLSPSLPPCPPRNLFSHITLLAKIALDPPELDALSIQGLIDAEETLRKGSKSFDVAKLAFGREMRIGLVVIYAWCRVTDNLIDEPLILDSKSEDTLHQARLDTLSAIRDHLHASYERSQADLDDILDRIPNLSPSARSAFNLFSSVIPRLVPIEPFLELCSGYETDMKFVSSSTATGSIQDSKSRLDGFNVEKHLPIKTTEDLLNYADDVAGSIASAICYLSWSILTPCPEQALQPVKDLEWARAVHSGKKPPSLHINKRYWIVEKAREMGRALQLVNVSRDIAKDALIGRLYVPLSSFPAASSVLSILFPGDSVPSYAPYSLPLLDIADNLRHSSKVAISHLPRTARGGTRAMVASYFEIAEAIRRRGGEVEKGGVKVDKWRRGVSAARAMWGLP